MSETLKTIDAPQAWALVVNGELQPQADYVRGPASAFGYVLAPISDGDKKLAASIGLELRSPVVEWERVRIVREADFERLIGQPATVQQIEAQTKPHSS